MWSPLPIGKHKGKTLPQILLSDPDYFFWAMARDDFFRGKLAQEAKDIYRKARQIKLPKPDPDNWRVEYVLSHDGKFAYFAIVDLEKPAHVGASKTARSPNLDFAYVRGTREYDKLGYKLFLKSFKQHYFGSPSARLTQVRCEAFFDDSQNFI